MQTGNDLLCPEAHAKSGQPSAQFEGTNPTESRETPASAIFFAEPDLALWHPAGRAMEATQVSPPRMAHRTRVDRMTEHHNESNEAWDREWTASPIFHRVC